MSASVGCGGKISLREIARHESGVGGGWVCMLANYTGFDGDDENSRNTEFSIETKELCSMICSKSCLN